VADNYLIINKSTLESKKEITKSETAPPINPHLSEETKVEEKPKEAESTKETNNVVLPPTKKLIEFPTEQEIKNNHPTFRGPFGKWYLISKKYTCKNGMPSLVKIYSGKQKSHFMGTIHQ